MWRLDMHGVCIWCLLALLYLDNINKVELVLICISSIHIISQHSVSTNTRRNKWNKSHHKDANQVCKASLVASWRNQSGECFLGKFWNNSKIHYRWKEWFCGYFCVNTILCCYIISIVHFSLLFLLKQSLRFHNPPWKKHTMDRADSMVSGSINLNYSRVPCQNCYRLHVYQPS